VKVGKFLPDILFRKTAVHTHAPCGQGTEFFNVKTYAVARNICALPGQSNFLQVKKMYQLDANKFIMI